MARLPTVNGDDGNWGTILNDYLSQSLKADGSLKPKLYGLASLSDVDITMPTNYQVLSYTSANSKWQNVVLAAGGTPFTYTELEPVAALLIGDALGFGSLPGYTTTSSTDSNGNAVTQTMTASANGALVADGYTVVAGDRLGVWDNGFFGDSSAGIYAVTAAGDGSHPFVLTRTADANPQRNWAVVVMNSDAYGSGITARMNQNYNSYDPDGEWFIALAHGGFSSGSGSAPGENAAAEGINTFAGDFGAHSEGYHTTASAGGSHAEGQNTTASRESAHAEGDSTTADNFSAHSEGLSSAAHGRSSHAEGEDTVANGDYSHAAGYTTTTNGTASHADGLGTTAYALGQYAHSSGNLDFSGLNASWSQYTRATANVKTSNNTPATLFVHEIFGSATDNSLQLPSWDLTAIVMVRVVAAVTPVSVGNASAWTFKGLISGNGSSSYRWVGGSPPTPTLISQDAAASTWTAILDIGSDNTSLTVTVTGQNGKSIVWHATIELDEVA